MHSAFHPVSDWWRTAPSYGGKHWHPEKRLVRFFNENGSKTPLLCSGTHFRE